MVYDLIFLVFTMAYLPLYLLRGKFHHGFFRRLGFLPDDLNLDRPIWVHAVSVGEAISIKGLVGELKKAYPDKKLVISTVTATGNKIARDLIADGDFLTYLPLDFSFIARKVIKKINPSLFIIAETEIWPNLITCLHKQKVPIVTVNGRISDRSYSGYRAIRFLIWPILSKIRQFCVQSDIDAIRLRKLGVAKENIQVTGNMKFEINLNLEPEKEPGVLANRQKLWLGSDDKLWVCGSTHAHEEEIIIKAYKELSLSFPKLKLLLAPRHPERSKDIGRLVSGNSFMPVFISNISGSCPTCVNNPIFILDVMGELFNYYSAADIVFVGGSLVKTGGHNILEPASLRKPVIFGTHMFNFRDITKLFLENKAGVMVADYNELVAKTKEILGSNLLAKQLVERAYELIIQNRGATKKNIEVIKQFQLN
ncbi:MAG: 3-deoxy-D-manno-octulosonic acid transferase [Candidatus Omnitrophica bacterium]|nr:3-deoxy-D-manno-octulosonic acid transferase [Candidatus Omnitrophota bacterium]MBU1923588.1 3-deoxy-D-manno-octulosonic acid transferase [Candidatus Omnitrophota bacterium]